MKKRILSMLLAIVMVVGMLPTTALAAEGPPDVVKVSYSDDYNDYGSFKSIEAAIEAAKERSGSTLRLLYGITTTNMVTIDSGSFTIDLNDQTWNGSSAVLQIGGDSDITITDSGYHGDGELLSTGNDSHTIELCDNAKLKIDKVMVKSICYIGGTIDLSEHNNPAGIQIYVDSEAVEPSISAIMLPDGYVMLDSSGNAVETLAVGGTYTVGNAPVNPDPDTTYPLWVGGEQFTSKKLTIEDENGGTATYNPDSNTLTLNNYTYTGEGHHDDDGDVAAIYYGGSEKLNLVLEGNSTVTQQSEIAPGYSFGILSSEVVSGDRSGGITVSGTGSLTATGGTAEDQSVGVYAYGTITVNSGKLTGIGKDAQGFSIGVYGNTITVNSGSLTGVGNDIAVYSGTYNGITINGGEVVASGTKWAFNSTPTIDETFDAAVWYGESENAANDAGAQDKSAIASTDDAKYVRIAPVTAYDLWVGGVQVTSVNAHDVFNDGKVSYDSTTNILTLNNYTYTGEGYKFNPTYNGTAAIYSGLRGLTIELVGENKLTNTAANGDGIYAGNTITISGIGSLEIVANEGDGIRLNGDGDRVLTISDSNVSINAGEYGIANSTGTIVLTTGVFNITAGEYGITLEGDLTITGSTVEITAGESAVAVSEFSLGEGEQYQWTTTKGSAMTSSAHTLYDYDTYGDAAYLKIAPFDLYVGGVAIAEGNYLAIDATQTTTTAPASGGYAHYENGVLTLNNYTYEDGGNTVFAIQYLGAPGSTLNINLVGQSSVTLTNDSSMGLVALRNVTVSGSGGLSIAGGSYGVDVMGDLTINSGSLTANGDNYGVNVFGNFTVNDGSLSAAGTDCDGVNVMGDLSVEGGSLTANGGRYGVNAMSNITVNGGSLTANGGSCGVNILPTKNVIVGADVKVYDAEGQEIEEPDYSECIYICILDPAVASVTVNGETTNYDSLAGAIGAVSACTEADNAEVKLLKDVELSDRQYIDGGVFTLDLNGFTIGSPTGVLDITGGTVILTDTSENKTGAITGRGEGICVSGGTVTIRGGTIQATPHEQPGLHYDAVSVTSGILSIEGGIIECDGEGVRAIGGEMIITGGSITGGTSDIATNNIYGTAVITLALADGAETGTAFPGGLSVSSTTLQKILVDGAAYWQGDEQITLTQNQSTITGGDVVVKKAVAVPPSDGGENDDTTSGQPDWPDYSEPSSGGSSNTTSKTEKNEDGSTTTTTTNKTTGTVTETTKYPDGSSTTVETKKDGSSTETCKTADGTSGTVVTDKDGNVTEVSAKVTSAAAKDAEESGEAVQLPIEVEAADDADEAVEIEVDVPTGGTKVEIPVENVTSGTVVVIVNSDGTEEVMKTSIVSENGVVVELDEDATIKVIDNSKHFTDVHPTDHWAEEAIDFVVARGIYSGTSATTFHPNNPMTRGMLAVVLHNLEDNPEHAFDGFFHDVAEDSWYEDAIHWAADEGIVSGYGNGHYGPNDNITREQLAVMLWRYAGSPDSDHSLDHFNDAHLIASYAETALAWANENGIINGKGNGILDPKGNATRAQVAQMLKNFMMSMQ